MNIAFTNLTETPRSTRSAAFRAGFGRLIASAGQNLRRRIDAAAQARAHRELAAFADRCEVLQPAFAAELRAAHRRDVNG